MTQNRKIKIALGQMTAVQGNPEENIKKMEAMTEQASAEGADIICFPELSCIGYFVKKERLLELCEPADGVLARCLSVCAAKNQISIIAGYAEQADGKVYNSCLVFDRTGKAVGNARKVHLWKSEKKRFEAGNDFPVFDMDFGKIAVINCYDLEFPEPSRIAALKGAELIFCPAAWSRPALNRWELDIRGNSLFNILYVAGANFVDELCCGSSAVAGPDGAFLAQASAEKEELLLAEIDLEKVKENREWLPYFEDMKKELFVRELSR